MTFEEAKARYVHRFTMEHVPGWAMLPFMDGHYPAPQYRSDLEWYKATLFPPNNPYDMGYGDCFSSGQTWPLGKRLDKPYTMGVEVAA